MLHYLRVGSRITITQSHTHTVQQTLTHKAVTGRVKAKKSLSRQMQSEYRYGKLSTRLIKEIMHFEMAYCAIKCANSANKVVKHGKLYNMD